MAADLKWTNNPFSLYVLKEFGHKHLNKFVKTVCSCGKKNNIQCARKFCAKCCSKSSETCAAHKQPKENKKAQAKQGDAPVKTRKRKRIR
jgi:hypothetical protein